MEFTFIDIESYDYNKDMSYVQKISFSLKYFNQYDF